LLYYGIKFAVYSDIAEYSYIKSVEGETWLFTNNPVFIAESSSIGMFVSVRSAEVAVLLGMLAPLVCDP